MRECIYGYCRNNNTCLYPDRAKDLGCPVRSEAPMSESKALDERDNAKVQAAESRHLADLAKLRAAEAKIAEMVDACVNVGQLHATLRERAEAAEAEVARLKAQLESVRRIAGSTDQCSSAEIRGALRA